MSKYTIRTLRDGFQKGELLLLFMLSGKGLIWGLRVQRCTGVADLDGPLVILPSLVISPEQVRRLLLFCVASHIPQIHCASLFRVREELSWSDIVFVDDAGF